MAKPFSIQSPEDVAKEYAGNKQRIAEAMQLGIVDPTAGVLAGMFIDRMRGAQMQEGANPPTVAQQVMGGAPPAPPVPLPPAGGLGATPPAAPPMAPQMGMAPAMSEGAPMPMAEGGLVGISIPDAMFDEPGNGGYAGGGLVAFSNGGSTGSSSWGAYIENMVRQLDPNIQISGRSRTPARNAEVGGVAGSYHLIDAARDIRTPEGMNKSEFIAQLKSVFGPDYDIIPSKGRSVHVEPGPKLGEKVRGGARPRSEGAYGIDRAYTTTDPLEVPEAPALSDILGQLGAYAGARGGEKTQAYLESMQLSPERRKEMKRMNEAAALAAAAEAFGGAGPFLGQVGTALGKATGALAEGKKGIREAELEGLKAGMTEEQQAYLDRLGILDPAARIRAAEVGVRESALGRKATVQEAEREREARSAEAALDRALQLEIAKARVSNPSDFEQMLRISQAGTPEEKAALLEVLRLKQQYAPSAAQPQDLASIFNKGTGAGAGGASGGNELDFSQLK
jgi:hypothetical protein